jgi:hypothetical protein
MIRQAAALQKRNPAGEQRAIQLVAHDECRRQTNDWFRPAR